MTNLQNLPNILPGNGLARYYARLLSPPEVSRYLNTFIETLQWQQDEVTMFGKKIITRRKVAWYGDSSLAYTYSGTTRYALPWTPQLLEVKNIVERACGHTFNTCLLNLYHNGSEAMGWHSDNEKELGNTPVIASVSLGAPRRFVFKHKKTKEKTEVLLEHGSLLIMEEETQQHWLHSLPATIRVKDLRVNLTFRNIVVAAAK